MEGGRGGGRERGKEGEKERGREGGRKGEREGGRREREREGERERGREGERARGREGGGGRERGREGRGREGRGREAMSIQLPVSQSCDHHVTHIRFSHEVLEVGDLGHQFSGGRLTAEELGGDPTVWRVKLWLDEHTASCQGLQGTRACTEGDTHTSQLSWLAQCHQQAHYFWPLASNGQ